MANIKSLQLLRNTSLYANRAAALEALTGSSIPASAQDGTPVLARYKNDQGKVITLVGYLASVEGETSHMTVFDYEGNAADIETLREEINSKLGNGITSANTATAQLTALSGNGSSTSAETSVEGAKRYADEKVRASLDALDYNLAKDANKVVVSLNQTNGKISGTSANITTVKLSGLATTSDTKIASTDTLGSALGKLQGQIDSMDLTVVSGEGNVIVSVSETDGKVNATKSAIKDVKLTGYVKDTSKTGAIAASDDIEDALSKIENTIIASQSATTVESADKTIKVTHAASGTDLSVNIDGTTLIKNGTTGVISSDLKIQKITQSSNSEWAAEYQLVYGNSNTPIGDKIQVARDQFLKDARYSASTQTLYLEVQNISGGTTVIPVDFSECVIESEAGNGLYMNSTDHSLNVGLDTNSEKVTTAQGVTADVLVVGSDNIKVQNIQNAIDYAVSTATDSLDATVTGQTSGNHITVSIEELNGKLVQSGFTIQENDIASQSKLDELSAKTFTVATSSNESITTAVTTASDGTKSVDLITDASKIKMSGFTAAEGGFSAISESSSITEAFKALETYILDNEETISAALNDHEDRLNAANADVESEIAARKAVDGQSGQTYTANSGKRYISGATSLNDADVKLNDAIVNINDNYINGVQVNGVSLPESSNIVNVQVEASSSAADSANAIVITQNSSTGKLTFALGTLDCGTY